MPLLQRTIKLALATCLAAALAAFLGLSNAISAGIIAILSVSDTRRSTIKLARNRLLSTILALAIGSLSFILLGFNLWSLGIYILLYVPLAYLFGWEIGITPSTVLVTHLLLAHSVSWSLLANEMAVFLIGTGFALLANLYMASNQQDIDNYRIQVEEQLTKILLFESRRRPKRCNSNQGTGYYPSRSLSTGLSGPFQPPLSSDQLPYSLF